MSGDGDIRVGRTTGPVETARSGPPGPAFDPSRWRQAIRALGWLAWGLARLLVAAAPVTLALWAIEAWHDAQLPPMTECCLDHPASGQISFLMIFSFYSLVFAPMAMPPVGIPLLAINIVAIRGLWRALRRAPLWLNFGVDMALVVVLLLEGLVLFPMVFR